MPVPISFPLIIMIGIGSYFEIEDAFKYNKKPFKVDALPGANFYAGPGGHPGFWLSNTKFGHLGPEVGVTYTFDQQFEIWRPIVGVKYFLATATPHYPTSQFLYAGAGFTYDKRLGDIAGHAIYATFPFMIGPHIGTSHYALGGPIAFNFAPGLAVDVNKSLRVSLSYDHTSNGFTAKPNFGINSIVLGAHYQF